MALGTGTSVCAFALRRRNQFWSGRQVGVVDRRQVQRHQLREQQPADHHQSQRLPRFAAGAVADGDRNGAQHGRHRGHHDRAEADQAALEDRLHGRLAFLPLRAEREIDLHDRVLLHDADQHDQPHERVDVQLDLEQVQGQQRAEARRGQAGEDRDGVDVALVQNSQHDVNDHDGHDQQHIEVLEGRLESLRRPLERSADGVRQHPGGDLVGSDPAPRPGTLLAPG